MTIRAAALAIMLVFTLAAGAYPLRPSPLPPDAWQRVASVTPRGRRGSRSVVA